MAISPARIPARLRVLHVATINKPIRPHNSYGPIETVIYNIDKGLTELGHDSIVASSADSRVVGELFPTVPQSLGDYCRDSTPENDARIDEHLRRALQRARAGDIDVIHMHQWYERVLTGRFNPPVPIVMTLHVPGHHSGMSELRTIDRGAFNGTRTFHSVAISEYQRAQYASLVPVVATVPHGLDVADCPFWPEQAGGSYLFHIGRITEVKGQDTAIEVARRTGKQLIIAGVVQNKPEDREFFARLQPSIDLVHDVSEEPVTADYEARVMAPLLASGKQIIYIGELSAEAAKAWYRNAEATLFPIRWGEPFGMVLIESMAAGTPVIAFGEGAVREIVRDGVTGFIVDSVDEMVRAVSRVPGLDRMAARRHVADRFSTRRMAEGYVAVYRDLIRSAQPVLALPAPAVRLTQAGPRLAATH